MKYGALLILHTHLAVINFCFNQDIQSVCARLSEEDSRGQRSKKSLGTGKGM